MVALKREQASALGAGTSEPYDALLEDYEPAETAEQAGRDACARAGGCGALLAETGGHVKFVAGDGLLADGLELPL